MKDLKEEVNPSQSMETELEQKSKLRTIRIWTSMLRNSPRTDLLTLTMKTAMTDSGMLSVSLVSESTLEIQI